MHATGVLLRVIMVTAPDKSELEPDTCLHMSIQMPGETPQDT